jgi:inositol oxygenase
MRTGRTGDCTNLATVSLSWGHEEYLSHVVKNHPPEPGLDLIRYHSFHPWHPEGEYGRLRDEHDRRVLSWVQKFNPDDLYSRAPLRRGWEKLRPYCAAVIDEYLPGKLRW